MQIPGGAGGLCGTLIESELSIHSLIRTYLFSYTLSSYTKLPTLAPSTFIEYYAETSLQQAFQPS